MLDCALSTLEVLKNSIEDINIDDLNYVKKRKELINFITNTSCKIKDTNINYKAQIIFSGTEYLDIGNIKSYIYEPNQVVDGVFLFIPSPLNRGNIFDLEESKSIAKLMCNNNHASVILDWQLATCDYTLDDLVENLSSILQALYKRYNKPVVLVGYCLGGILATNLAQKYSSYCKSLVLLATPWDFSNTIFYSLSNLMDYHNMYNQPEFWRYLFFLINPEKIYDKYINTVTDGYSDILESWLYNVLPLPSSFNQQLFKATKVKNWYGIMPEIDLPNISVISVSGDNDYIVPYNASKLPRYFNYCKTSTISVNTGHIGLIISNKSKEQLWNKLPYIIENI